MQKLNNSKTIEEFIKQSGYNPPNGGWNNVINQKIIISELIAYYPNLKDKILELSRIKKYNVV